MTPGYEKWTEADLLLEISRRKLAHGVNSQGFPDERARRARLAEILTDNDRFKEA